LERLLGLKPPEFAGKNEQKPMVFACLDGLQRAKTSNKNVTHGFSADVS
jgi:hypothetical protein